MAEFNSKDVMQMLGQAQKRPDNRIAIRVKGTILKVDSYTKKDQTVGHNVTIWRSETGDIVKFTTSKPYKQGDVHEVVLTLTGFYAFEAR